MPVPLIPVAVVGAGAVVALARKTGALPDAVPEPAAIAPAKGGNVPAVSPVQSAVGLAAAVGVGAALGALGAPIDRAINPNSNDFSRTVAGVALGVSGGLAVAVATGALTPILIALGCASLVPFLWPIVACVIALAALTYLFVVVIQDLVALQFGQQGGREKYADHFASIYSNLRDAVEKSAAGSAKTETERERQLVPLAEGFMQRINWSAYQSWMGQKGVRVDGSPYDGIGSSSRSGIPGTVRLGGTFPGTSTKVTADLLWHFNFAIDRGYWVGDGEGMRTLGGPTPRFDALFVPNSRWPLSKGNDWVLAHCPPEELQPLDASESIHQFVQGLSLADGRALVVEGFAAWGASMPQLKKDAFAAQVSEVMAGGGRGVPAERSAGWLKYIQEIDSGKLTAERNALWQLWVAGKGPVPGAAPTLVATAGTPVAAPVAPSTTGTGTRRPLPFPLPPTALRP